MTVYSICKSNVYKSILQGSFRSLKQRFLCLWSRVITLNRTVQCFRFVLVNVRISWDDAKYHRIKKILQKHIFSKNVTKEIGCLNNKVWGQKLILYQTVVLSLLVVS